MIKLKEEKEKMVKKINKKIRSEASESIQTEKKIYKDSKGRYFFLLEERDEDSEIQIIGVRNG